MPKSHFEDVYDMPDQQFSELFLSAKKIAKALKAAISAKRIGLAIEGLGVSHVHIHLVPVNSGNELNPERAKNVSETELRQMYEKLLPFFRDLNQNVNRE